MVGRQNDLESGYIDNDTIQVICAVHKGFEEMEKNVDMP